MYATLIMVLNMFVIALALVSFLLCFRALVRNHLLKLETEIFLTRHHGWVFTFEEKFKFLFQFLNLWYLTICIRKGKKHSKKTSKLKILPPPRQVTAVQRDIIGHFH